MTLEETEKWLKDQSLKGNDLAKMYSSILEGSHPQVKKMWLENLAAVIDSMKQIVIHREEIQSEILDGKE